MEYERRRCIPLPCKVLPFTSGGPEDSICFCPNLRNLLRSSMVFGLPLSPPPFTSMSQERSLNCLVIVLGCRIRHWLDLSAAPAHSKAISSVCWYNYLPLKASLSDRRVYSRPFLNRSAFGSDLSGSAGLLTVLWSETDVHWHSVGYRNLPPNTTNALAY